MLSHARTVNPFHFLSRIVCFAALLACPTAWAMGPNEATAKSNAVCIPVIGQGGEIGYLPSDPCPRGGGDSAENKNEKKEQQPSPQEIEPPIYSPKDEEVFNPGALNLDLEDIEKVFDDSMKVTQTLFDIGGTAGGVFAGKAAGMTGGLALSGMGAVGGVAGGLAAWGTSEFIKFCADLSNRKKIKKENERIGAKRDSAWQDHSDDLDQHHKQTKKKAGEQFDDAVQGQNDGLKKKKEKRDAKRKEKRDNIDRDTEDLRSTDAEAQTLHDGAMASSQVQRDQVDQGVTQDLEERLDAQDTQTQEENAAHEAVMERVGQAGAGMAQQVQDFQQHQREEDERVMAGGYAARDVQRQRRDLTEILRGDASADILTELRQWKEDMVDEEDHLGRRRQMRQVYESVLQGAEPSLRIELAGNYFGAEQGRIRDEEPATQANRQRIEYHGLLRDRALNRSAKLRDFTRNTDGVRRWQEQAPRWSDPIAGEFRLPRLRPDTFAKSEVLGMAAVFGERLHLQGDADDEKKAEATVGDGVLGDPLLRLQTAAYLHEATLYASAGNTKQSLRYIDRVWGIVDHVRGFGPYSRGAAEGLKLALGDVAGNYWKLVAHPVDSACALGEALRSHRETFAALNRQIQQVLEAYPRMSPAEKGELHGRILGEAIGTLVPLGAFGRAAGRLMRGSRLARTLEQSVKGIMESRLQGGISIGRRGGGRRRGGGIWVIDFNTTLGCAKEAWRILEHTTFRIALTPKSLEVCQLDREMVLCSTSCEAF